MEKLIITELCDNEQAKATSISTYQQVYIVDRQTTASSVPRIFKVLSHIGPFDSYNVAELIAIPPC